MKSKLLNFKNLLINSLEIDLKFIT